MTAAARRPLHIIADTDEHDDTAAIGAHAGVDVEILETWQSQTVLNQLEPEHQLIGALMWMSAEQARPILELVPDTAISEIRARSTYWGAVAS